MTDILVIGSINVDHIVVTNHLPKLGETVIGSQFKTVPGGKGANQAIAASRLGAKVDFIGCVGADANGDFLLNNFKKNNINIENIKILNNTTSGIASITVFNGQNSIIVIPGANNYVSRNTIDQNLDQIKNSKIVLLQLEIPIGIVEYIIDICYKNKIPVILNPAPATKLTKNIIEKVTYLTPNEHEAEYIFKTNNYHQLVSTYPNKLIITLGEEGAIYNDGNKTHLIPAYDVQVVDTTGAGDTFNGALAYSIINNKDIFESIKFANQASALKIKKMGAQSGMPTKKEMEEFNEKTRNIK